MYSSILSTIFLITTPPFKVTTHPLQSKHLIPISKQLIDFVANKQSPSCLHICPAYIAENILHPTVARYTRVSTFFFFLYEEHFQLKSARRTLRYCFEDTILVSVCLQWYTALLFYATFYSCFGLCWKNFGNGWHSFVFKMKLKCQLHNNWVDTIYSNSCIFHF